ncbi:hypothetical protein HPB51_013613 [Rhipicephalus microplus]|uniref:Transposase protein n=1 Tax=Rhipicephalus microplus TaxID=6941 RepID=A0A9J6EHN5_RHIMP|nr:hypothetical protein HPB51_013613 [Rhipicephalus microplus]
MKVQESIAGSPATGRRGTSNADSSQEERASAEPGEVYSSENPIETAQEAEWLHFPSSQDNMEDCSSVIQGEHQKRPVRRSMTSQTSIGLKKMRSLVAATKTLRRKCSRLKEMNSNLHSQLEKLKKDFFEMKALAEANGALTLQEMLDENDKKAEFLKEQLQCLREKNHRWKEVTIRQAIMWQAKSPCGYEMLRRSGCLTLPSRMTLKRYIGYCTGAVVSSLMKQRLHTESTHLSEREKMGSLIVDEMSLKQALTYEKKGDKVHGLVEMGGLEKEVGIQNELATHLLAFVFVGLSTHYTLPVGYYFTQSVKGDHLHQLTLEVIKSIEEAGFQVVRLVADNHASNKKMFTMLGNGRMMPVVPHPMDMNRRLFLSFDHCHILKNLRNQMLSTKRVLFNNGHYYSPTYLRKLLDITEKQSSFKLVRNLTQKHVYPTNFEKLSVKRAVEVFSPQACIRKGVTSALRYLLQYGRRFGIFGFEDCLPTIELMEMIFKWFTIHNIRNTTFHVVSRDQNRMPFSSPDDDRLIWLEQEFLPFFAAWKAAAPHKRAFISLETYEALQLTTMSTVQCTQFLIRSGFLYVLTAKFSSDPVEALFSTIRQLQGSNDQTDARAALSSLQKVLVMGMMHSSPSGSTEQTTSPLGSPSARQASCSTAVKQAGQPLEMHSLVNQNQGSSGECAASTSATITQTMRPHLEALQTCRGGRYLLDYAHDVHSEVVLIPREQK